MDFSDLTNIIWTTAIIAAIIFLLISFVIGYFPLESKESIRRVPVPGTTKRNISAALVIVTLNFTDMDVMVIIIVIALAGLMILVERELGEREEMPASQNFVATEIYQTTRRQV